MTLQERKDKVDIIAKYGELIYKKLIILSAIAGGSWLFGIKEVGTESYFALIAFGLSAVGVVVNLFRLGEAIQKIKGYGTMSIEILYGITLVSAIVLGAIAYKKHWKLVDWF